MKYLGINPRKSWQGLLSASAPPPLPPLGPPETGGRGRSSGCRGNLLAAASGGRAQAAGLRGATRRVSERWSAAGGSWPAAARSDGAGRAPPGTPRSRGQGAGLPCSVRRRAADAGTRPSPGAFLGLARPHPAGHRSPRHLRQRPRRATHRTSPGRPLSPGILKEN